MKSYLGFDVNLFRVECPVCKSRRPLNENEKKQIDDFDSYHSYQFCMPSCKDRANGEQKMAVEVSNPHKGKI